jgi:hypothetical protein
MGFTATAAVTFGGINAASFVVDSDLQITALTPAGLGTVDITVTSLAGSGTLAGGFKYVSSILKGINLSGFSDRGLFYHPASHAQMDFYKAKGMNFFRIPIWWERLQPTLSAAFDLQHWRYLIGCAGRLGRGRVWDGFGSPRVGGPPAGSWGTGRGGTTHTIYMEQPSERAFRPG